MQTALLAFPPDGGNAGSGSAAAGSTCVAGSVDGVGFIPLSFICHTGLIEQGDGIPENKPRKIAELVRDRELVALPGFAAMDFSAVPADWPPFSKKGERRKGCVADETGGDGGDSGGDGGGVAAIQGSKSRINAHANQDRRSDACSSTAQPTNNTPIDEFLLWIAQRPEQSIAVVFHHNTIQKMLGYTDKNGPLADNHAIRQQFSRIGNCSPISCVLVDLPKHGSMSGADSGGVSAKGKRKANPKATKLSVSGDIGVQVASNCVMGNHRSCSPRGKFGVVVSEQWLGDRCGSRPCVQEDLLLSHVLSYAP
jgi:hypothetical protein